MSIDLKIQLLFTLFSIGFAIFFWILSFTITAKLDDDSSLYRMFGTMFLIIFIILSHGASNKLSHCPNCDTWTDFTYCQECGTEVSPTIDCPGCQKEFDLSEAPAFCPDCGTKVKE